MIFKWHSCLKYYSSIRNWFEKGHSVIYAHYSASDIIPLQWSRRKYTHNSIPKNIIFNQIKHGIYKSDTNRNLTRFIFCVLFVIHIIRLIVFITITLRYICNWIIPIQWYKNDLMSHDMLLEIMLSFFKLLSTMGVNNNMR